MQSVQQYVRYIVNKMAFQVINHNMNLQTALIINTLSKVSLDRQNWYTDLKKMMMMMTTRIINGWKGQNWSTHFDDFQVLPNVPQSRLKNQPRLENVSRHLHDHFYYEIFIRLFDIFEGMELKVSW